ncbi:MAG: aspartate-alanine antiporter-like transporter, partial [Planctomycetota bacterium]
LERGDHVMAKGKVNQLHLFEGIVGRELYDEEMQNRMPSPRAIHVSSAQAVNKRLNELNLVQRHRCLVTEVVRGDVSIEPSAELRLARDDVIYVSGRRDDVRAVARELGRFERSTNETDIAIYAGGILLGLLVGSLRVGGFGIGMAAGLLLAGVFLGRFRRIGPFSAHVPAAARQLVRDLGILLFVAEAGVRAGGGSLEGIRPVLWPTLVSGALTSVIPVLAALLVGRHLLKMRPVDTWGSVGGGMTSSAALVAVKDAADSSEPAISYAASYAVASVLATFAGHAVLLLL